MIQMIMIIKVKCKREMKRGKMKETNSNGSLRQLYAEGTVKTTIEDIKQAITASIVCFRSWIRSPTNEFLSFLRLFLIGKRNIVLDGTNGGNQISGDRRSSGIAGDRL